MVRGQPQTDERRFSESLKIASKFQVPGLVAWAKNAGQGLSFLEARTTSSIHYVIHLQLNSFPWQIDGGTPCRFVALVISLELA